MDVDLPAFKDNVRRRVYPITRALLLGPFASPERRPALLAAGVTHVLNVGEAPNILTPANGPFQEVAWHPITDLERIPDELALQCLSTLHRMACVPGSRVYVHCLAGWNRSPTVLWLYLVACGLEPSAAKEAVTARAWDAIPGHARLVDAQLVRLVQQHGLHKLLPHPRPEALEFV
jgi:protein-tyrosine phosphatase